MVAPGKNLRATNKTSKPRSLSLERQGPLRVDKRDEVRQRSDWRGAEPCMLIESRGLFMQRVDKQGPDTGNSRRLRQSSAS